MTELNADKMILGPSVWMNDDGVPNTEWVSATYFQAHLHAAFAYFLAIRPSVLIFAWDENTIF